MRLFAALPFLTAIALAFEIENEYQLSRPNAKAPKAKKAKTGQGLPLALNQPSAKSRRSRRSMGVPKSAYVDADNDAIEPLNTEEIIYDERQAWALPDYNQAMQTTPSDAEYVYRAGPERFWMPANAPIKKEFPGPFLPLFNGVPGQTVNDAVPVANALAEFDPPFMTRRIRNSDVTDPKVGYAALDPTEAFLPDASTYNPRNPITPLQPGNLSNPLNPAMNNYNGVFNPQQPFQETAFLPFVRESVNINDTLADADLAKSGQSLGSVYLYDPLLNQAVVFDPNTNKTRKYTMKTDPPLQFDTPLPLNSAKASNLEKTTNPASNYVWLMKPLDKSTTPNAPKKSILTNALDRSSGTYTLPAPPGANAARKSKRRTSSKPSLANSAGNGNGPLFMRDPVPSTGRRSGRMSRKSRKSRKSVSFAPGTKNADKQPPASPAAGNYQMAQNQAQQIQAINNQLNQQQQNNANWQNRTWFAPEGFNLPISKQPTPINQLDHNSSDPDHPYSIPDNNSIRKNDFTTPTSAAPRRRAQEAPSASVSAKKANLYNRPGSSKAKNSSAGSIAGGANPAVAIAAIAIILIQVLF